MWNIALQPLKTLYLHYHNVYGHQTWQGGDLPWGALTHKATWPLGNNVVLQNHVMNWKQNISTARVPMATKLGRMVTYLGGIVSIKSRVSQVTWSCGIMWLTNENYYISTTTMPRVTKFGRMVTYLALLSPVKPHDPLVTWSCKITW